MTTSQLRAQATRTFGLSLVFVAIGLVALVACDAPSDAPKLQATPRLSQQGTMYPAPGWVVDEAGKLSADGKQKIVNLVAAENQRTGNQVVVVVVNNLRGLTVEDYANGLFKEWGIGHKGKDNGVLLLVSTTERKIRIETGYGTEARLTDAKTKTIIKEYIGPNLKKEDFDTGLREGAGAIIRALNEKRT